MTGEQSSQTSKGISCPGQKLNNGRPCMPCLGPANTGSRPSSVSYPLCWAPPPIVVWPTASRLGGRALSREQEVKEVIVDLSGSSKFSLNKQMKQNRKAKFDFLSDGRKKHLKVSIWYQLTLWLLLLIDKHQRSFFVPYYFLYVGIN